MLVKAMSELSPVRRRVFELVALQRRCVVVGLHDRLVIEWNGVLYTTERRRHDKDHIARWDRQHDERSIAAGAHRHVERRMLLLLRSHQLEQRDDLVASLGTSSIDEDALVELLLLGLGRRHVVAFGWIGTVIAVIC